MRDCDQSSCWRDRTPVSRSWWARSDRRCCRWHCSHRWGPSPVSSCSRSRTDDRSCCNCCPSFPPPDLGSGYQTALPPRVLRHRRRRHRHPRRPPSPQTRSRCPSAAHSPYLWFIMIVCLRLNVCVRALVTGITRVSVCW